MKRYTTAINHVWHHQPVVDFPQDFKVHWASVYMNESMNGHTNKRQNWINTRKLASSRFLILPSLLKLNEWKQCDSVSEEKWIQKMKETRKDVEDASIIRRWRGRKSWIENGSRVDIVPALPNQFHRFLLFHLINCKEYFGFQRGNLLWKLC